jgi:hypothetical protein
MKNLAWLTMSSPIKLEPLLKTSWNLRDFLLDLKSMEINLQSKSIMLKELPTSISAMNNLILIGLSVMKRLEQQQHNNLTTLFVY